MAHRRILRFVASLALFAAVTRSDNAAAEQNAVPAKSASSHGSIQSAYIDSHRAMLYSENFDKLDSEADVLLVTKARFPGGDWKPYRFFGAVGRPIGGYGDLSERSTMSDVPFANAVHAPLDESAVESAWQRHLSVLRHWHAARPKSSTGILALAEALVGYAWHARGSGYVDTVSNEQDKLFHERLSEAERLLSQHRSMVSRSPQFFCLMIDIGRGQGFHSNDVYRFVSAAMAVEPSYLHVYSTAARALTPRWLGEPGEWEHFANDVSQRLGSRDGSVAYGHIMWQIGMLYGMRAFFNENLVSWPRIKQGFLDREAIYGPSPELLSAFALLAVTAGDQKTAHDVFTEIGGQWDVTVWRQREYFDSCRKWAGAE